MIAQRSAPLSAVAKLIRGITFSPEEVVPVGQPGTVVCFRTANVQEELDQSDLIAVPASRISRNEQRVRAGDILVSSANSWNLVGKCCSVPALSFEAAAGGFISILRSDDSAVDGRYLFRWLSSPRTQHLARLCARQTTSIANLSFDRFLALRVPLPSLADQRRTAAMLDKADAVRRKRRETIKVLDDFLRSAFLEMFGDPLKNEKRLETVRLGDVVEFTGGGTPSRAMPQYFTGDICWASSKDIVTEELFDTQEHITEEALENSATKRLPAGTILIVVKSKILMHRLPIAITRVPVCISQDLKGISIKTHSVSPNYLARHLRIGQQALLQVARGANTEGLTLQHLENYKLMIPGRPMLESWEAIETRASTLRGFVGKASVASSELFGSLAQQAFA